MQQESLDPGRLHSNQACPLHLRGSPQHLLGNHLYLLGSLLHLLGSLLHLLGNHLHLLGNLLGIHLREIHLERNNVAIFCMQVMRLVTRYI